ncbi:VCBS domain-containing protein, partial [Aliarcobacter cryaerophilus]|uniref:VCBS domain-containing protein n=1 Tax=Aliarcobacter cryaerophilus TaxID=28198 RepID=UPI003DA291B1
RDVYNDPSSLTATVTAINGGNFEATSVAGATATAQISDTPDTVYVDVTADNTNLSEGAVVTYTVTLRNQDGLEVKNHAGLKITLSNGLTIDIPAGQTSGTGEGKATLGSNTIKVQTIVETATAGSGQKFEDIQAGKTVTVNANSASLKNYTKTATEDGSENVASEDSLDKINGKDDGLNVSDTLKNIQNKSITISKVVFEGTSYDVKSSFTTIKGKYGTLEIKSNGEYRYTVDNENPNVDALNVGDKLADNFEYVVKSGRDELKAVLTIEVEGRNDAPIIKTIETNGVTLTGVYNDYQKDNITKDITAHDLLKEDKGVIFNNENSNLSMNLGTSGTDVSISYLGGNGSYKNILGFYEIDANGNKTNLKIMYIDKNSDFENLSSNPKELTQLKNLKGEIGFFLISDGYSNENIKKAIDNNWEMTVDESNNIIFKKGNDIVKANHVFYSNETSNNDGLDHTVALKQNNGLIIGFEDQYGGGDKDYDDFVISVKFTPTESLTNKLFTNIDFSDVDDVNLSEATVTLTNAIDGDKINIAGDLKEGIKYTTEYKDGKLIVKFTGIASHEAYEEAIEAIRFSTNNSEEERELNFDIEIKDPNGKTDKTSTVIIGKGFDNDAPTIENENVQTKEDTPYTFSIEDFASYSDKNGDSIETIKIVTLPDSTKGVLKYDGVEISADKEILVKDLGKLVFVPVSNSDKDASFTFQISDDRGAYSDIKTMTIGVEAVADAPTVSIDIKSAGTVEVSTGASGNVNSGTGSEIKRLDFETYLKAVKPLTGTSISQDKNYNNANPDDDDILKFTTNLNNRDVKTGAGDDYVYFEKQSSVKLNLGVGNNEAHFNEGMSGSIVAGDGNDEVRINHSINQPTINLGGGDNKLYIQNISNSGDIKFGEGSDKLVIDGSADNSKIELGGGNNTVSIKGNYGGKMTSGDGNDTIIIGGNINKENTTIDTGAGNDFVQVHGVINNNLKLNLGDGDDGFRYSRNDFNDSRSGMIDGGSGFDTFYLNGNSNQYVVYIKSNDSWVKDVKYDKTTPFNDKSLHVISWETYVELNKDFNGQADREFYIAKSGSMNDNEALRIKNFESISFDDKIFGGKVVTTTVHKYDITVNAKLTDTDRSEKLSDVTLKNIPEGSKLFGADGKEIMAEKGIYKIPLSENGGEVKLTLTSTNEVSPDKLNGIQVSATSTEISNKDSATTTVTKDTISFDGSGDIDLSNLKNITEINLDNGKENKLSLTLDDVLKMSGDDNTIKIYGDAFDKVALKGENDWKKSETSLTEGDKTFDVYSGSVGDQTVQVKVEQPISDGITN